MTFIVFLKILWLVTLCTGFGPLWILAIGIMYLLDKKLGLINTGMDWDC